MLDYIELGATPSEEPCAQVGSALYVQQSRRECRAYRNQLRRMFVEPPGARFEIKTFEHDFGTYREVIVAFLTDVPDAKEFAYRVEAEAPGYWDDEALRELGRGAR